MRSTTDEEVHCDGYSGVVLPNGNLIIRTSGRTPDGEMWDGRIEVTPEHPSYALWLSQINNKVAYYTALNEERKRAREQRRQKSQL